eukprot:874627-Pleurochrysis_carterae.AAC.1
MAYNVKQVVPSSQKQAFWRYLSTHLRQAKAKTAATASRPARPMWLGAVVVEGAVAVVRKGGLRCTVKPWPWQLRWPWLPPYN